MPKTVEWMTQKNYPDILFNELEISSEYVFLLKDILGRNEGFRDGYLTYQAVLLSGVIQNCNKTEIVLHIAEKCFRIAWSRTIYDDIERGNYYEMVFRFKKENRQSMNILDYKISPKITIDDINKILQNNDKESLSSLDISDKDR